MVNQTKIDGYQLQIGKRVVGEIAELDEKFAVIKMTLWIASLKPLSKRLKISLKTTI